MPFIIWKPWPQYCSIFYGLHRRRDNKAERVVCSNITGFAIRTVLGVVIRNFTLVFNFRHTIANSLLYDRCWLLWSCTDRWSRLIVVEYRHTFMNYVHRSFHGHVCRPVLSPGPAASIFYGSCSQRKHYHSPIRGRAALSENHLRSGLPCVNTSGVDRVCNYPAGRLRF
jgi:hypothetical protein